MPIYENEVADKVIRVLQAANRVDAAKLTEARGTAAGPSDILVQLIRNEGVDEELVHTVISRAYALRRTSLEAKQVDVRALPLIPKQFIDDHLAMPYEVEARFLRVAIVDPSTASLAGQLKNLSNFNIEFQLITLTNFENLRAHERIKAVLDAAEKKQKAEAEVISAKRRSKFPIDDDSLVPEFCDHILHSAIDTGTSDIHIEPFRDIARIRFLYRWQTSNSPRIFRLCIQAFPWCGNAFQNSSRL